MTTRRTDQKAAIVAAKARLRVARRQDNLAVAVLRECQDQLRAWARLADAADQRTAKASRKGMRP